VTRRPHITSSANDRLKAVRRLARRRSQSVFLVEGHRQLARALAAGIDLEAVYAAPSLFLGDRDHELVALAEGRSVRVVELGAAAFRSVSAASRPDGLLAVARRWATALSSLGPDGAPLLLVAEGLERPGNLGTIVRSACSAGATGLLACDTTTDVFHPEVVRGSVGTLFDLPVATCTARQALPWLREHGVRIVVATPGAERACWDAPLTGPVALVVGSERHGVSGPWLAAADERVSIPMPGPADSLNVAVAAGIVLFEAVRQRAAAGPP
jgi:TrmH family RNA methyltransferase